MTSGKTLQHNNELLLRHPSFVRFWLARTFSSFGFQMLSVAASWQIYAITNSAMALKPLKDRRCSRCCLRWCHLQCWQAPRRQRLSAGKVRLLSSRGWAGLLYVAGPDVVYGVAAAFYVLSIVMIARIHFIRAPQPRLPATIKTLFAGVRFICERRDVLGVISFNLFAARLPIFAKDILHTGPWGLGMLRGAPSVGALLVGIWLSRNKLEKNVGMIMFGSVDGFGVATLIFGLSSQLWRWAVSMVIRGALVQLDTPDDMRGRVNAVNSIFINTSNQLGEFESGLLARAKGGSSGCGAGRRR